MFARYLTLWELAPDGAPIVTPRAQLLPVRMHDNAAAMLKVVTEPGERFGGVLLDWWDGQGAARLLQAEGDALLIERATGNRSLSEFARNGRDDDATAILCEVVAKLHSPRGKPPPALVPLEEWFRELWPAARAHALLARSAETARRLLADPRDVVPLHGDIHHGNVLDFGDRGWLAIDPKRIRGERGFDYANIFTNPDMDDPSRPVATMPETFRRRLAIVVDRSGIERRRLLDWIIAWTGLSAAWILGDGDDPAVDLEVLDLAVAEADRG